MASRLFACRCASVQGRGRSRAFLAADDDTPPPPQYVPPPLTPEYVADLRRAVTASADDEHAVLQLPIAPAWYDHAACADMDPEAFHDGSAEAVVAAKAVCADCPAITACRDLAVADPTLLGVWGGLTERERTEARRQGGQLRQRPHRGHARHSSRPVQPCGTTAAYQRHRKRGEEACEGCKWALREARRASRKEAATEAA